MKPYIKQLKISKYKSPAGKQLVLLGYHFSHKIHSRCMKKKHTVGTDYRVKVQVGFSCNPESY